MSFTILLVPLYRPNGLSLRSRESSGLLLLAAFPVGFCFCFDFSIFFSSDLSSESIELASLRDNCSNSALNLSGDNASFVFLLVFFSETDVDHEFTFDYCRHGIRCDKRGLSLSSAVILGMRLEAFRCLFCDSLRPVA